MLTPRRTATATAIAATALLATAPSALAGSVGRSGSDVVVDLAEDAGADDVRVLQDGAAIVVYTDAAPLLPCTPGAPGTVRCATTGVARVLVRLGAGDDRASGRPSPLTPVLEGPLSIPLRIEGGAGDDSIGDGDARDTLLGDEGADTLRAEAGDDMLDGGPGADTLSGGANADDLRGGEGTDRVSYAAVSTPLRVTLDDRGDDGNQQPFEGDNVHSDVEHVLGGAGNDELIGNDLPNALLGGPGNDLLDGGGGFDDLDGESGDDRIQARDGNAERIDCGGGADAVVRDTFDSASGCEADDASPILQGDLDADGVTAPADCNDRDARIRPGAVDLPGNGVDENCDGRDAPLIDRDGDGSPIPQDCDDVNRSARPGAREIFGNAVDEDCSGRADPLQAFDSSLRGLYRTSRRSTLVRRLQVSDVPAGTLVRIAYTKGRRSCPARVRRRARQVQVRSARALFDVRRELKLKTVRAGVRLDIRLTRPDSIAKRFQVSFASSRSPKLTTRCQRPGAREGRCP